MADLMLIDMLDQYDQRVVETKDQTETVFSKSHMSTLLKELRKSKVERHDIVLLWGPKLLKYESYVEVWNLSEQIAYAAIDMGQFEYAKCIIDDLEKQFPGSIRVSRILGMFYEAQSMFPEAMSIYEDVLKRDITNLAIMKRKVCIHKATKDTKALVEEINNVLNFYPSDTGSWLELGEIYVAACDFAAASHCFEELILLDPRNAHYHCRLAETLYSQGNDRILQARKHFSISLTHQNPSYNLRALYGLTAACQAIQELDFSKNEKFHMMIDDHERKVNSELLRWAREQFECLSNEKSNNVALAIARATLFC